jgi:hypothetical protein
MDVGDFGTQKDSQNNSLRRANEVVTFLRGFGKMLLVLSFLAGCTSLGTRDYFANDQVPQSAKDEPRLVASPPPITGNEPWPLLGQVPSNPKDFSPKPVYDHYMDELAYDKIAAQAEKREVESEDAAANPPQASDTGVSQAHAPIAPQFIGH